MDEGSKPVRSPRRSPRTRDLYDRLQERIREEFGIDDYDPLISAVVFVLTPEHRCSGELRTGVEMQAAGYFHAKMKTIEVSGRNGDPIELKVERVEKLRRELLDELD